VKIHPLIVLKLKKEYRYTSTPCLELHGLLQGGIIRNYVINVTLPFCSRYYCPMPKLTPECDRIIVFGYQKPDPTNFIAEHFFKVALMTLEILSIEDYNLSTIFIFDFRNYTLGHVPKITLPLSKKCETCTMVSIRQCVIRAANFGVKIHILAPRNCAQVILFELTIHVIHNAG
jgi:hypothetical protein